MYVSYRRRSNHELEPAMATDWSMTHSPTPRYLSIHVVTCESFWPEILSARRVRPVERFMPARMVETGKKHAISCACGSEREELKRKIRDRVQTKERTEHRVKGKVGKSADLSGESECQQVEKLSPARTHARRVWGRIRARSGNRVRESGTRTDIQP